MNSQTPAEASLISEVLERYGPFACLSIVDSESNLECEGFRETECFCYLGLDD
jgi:hypothetical protein